MFAYLRLVRFPLIFTAVADSLAGYLIGLRRGTDPVEPRVVALLVVVSATLYAVGMACNDIADRDRDKLLHPARVLPTGAVSLRGAWTCVLALLAVSGGALGTLSILAPRAPEAIGIGRVGLWGAMVGMIFLYDFGGKVFALGGPILMGLIRACNFLLGLVYSPTTLELDQGVALFAAASFVYVMCLALASTLEEGPPRRRLFAIAAAGMLAAALGAGAIGWFVVWTFFAPAVAVTALLVAWVGFRIVDAARLLVRARIMRLVRDGVMAIILLDASVVLWSGRLLEGGIVAALLVPATVSLHGFAHAARR
ncbi:MAG: hypothetical protein HYY17_15340 [Planctomycetes bacterium]|nr:hypothetical protein [Planctomycetota bacterium]